MSEIPKIARERLAHRAAGTGSHPDADQLTAFQERALGAREREQVLEHLARCAQCREVVALALAPEEAARLAQLAPRFRWLEWQTLRWAAVAATFVIAVTLVFQSYREAPETLSRETAQNRPVAATPPAEKQAEPARTDEFKTGQEATAAPAAKTKASTSSTAAASRDQEAEVTNGPSKLDSVTRAKTGQKSGELAGVSGGRMDDYKKLGSVGKAEVGAIASKAASAPAPEVAAEAKRGPAAPAAQQVAGLAQSAQPPSPPTTREEAKGQPVATAESRTAAERAETVQVSGQNEIVNVEKDANQRARKAAATREAFDAVVPLSKASATMRWIITAEGRVQRTIDNGQTWKSVALEARIRFRAVSAAGSEVWAGGEGGALYHSSDSGNHWSRVSLPPEISSAPIVRIEFTDAKHGALSTSSGEIWTTSDAGATWQRK